MVFEQKLCWKVPQIYLLSASLFVEYEDLLLY